MKELDPHTVEGSELVEQTFEFWFNNNGHIRSPFPEYIRPILKEKAVERFHKWASSLNDKAKDELNDTIVAEKFEEIIFETAINMVDTEDEKITINYPFLPRLNDETVKDDESAKKSVVKSRSITKDGDQLFMSLKLEEMDSGNSWETKIELPG